MLLLIVLKYCIIGLEKTFSEWNN